MSKRKARKKKKLRQRKGDKSVLGGLWKIARERAAAERRSRRN